MLKRRNCCRIGGVADSGAVSALPTILLNNGGIRSLVATAMVLSSAQAQAVTLLHVRCQQPARDARLSASRHQAAHFTRCKHIEIDEALVRVHSAAPAEKPVAKLAPPAAASSLSKLPILRLLSLAMAQAVAQEATRIIWPVSFNGDFRLSARALEQASLLRHLVSTEIENPPLIECPLVDLSNRQIVELGSQLQVNWAMSWTCEQEGPQPCEECSGCRRRIAAFSAAGIVDPLMDVKSTRAA